MSNLFFYYFFSIFFFFLLFSFFTIFLFLGGGLPGGEGALWGAGRHACCFVQVPYAGLKGQSNEIKVLTIGGLKGQSERHVWFRYLWWAKFEYVPVIK